MTASVWHGHRSLASPQLPHPGISHHRKHHSLPHRRSRTSTRMCSPPLDMESTLRAAVPVIAVAPPEARSLAEAMSVAASLNVVGAATAPSPPLTLSISAVFSPVVTNFLISFILIAISPDCFVLFCFKYSTLSHTSTHGGFRPGTEHDYTGGGLILQWCSRFHLGFP